MQPPFDTRGRLRDVDGPRKPPPDPIVIAREIGEMILNRWVFAALLVASLAAGVYTIWPEPVERVEMDYLTLQNIVIRGGVESITIRGDEARGTFHGTVPAANGEVVGISEPVPPGVSNDDMYEANAFVVPVPGDSRESFIAMAKQRGIEVSDESR